MTIINHDMTKIENVLEFLRLSVFNDEKYIIIQGDFAKGFWKLWHKQKKNTSSVFRKCYPHANVYKTPKGEWRLYFNEDKEDQEYELQQTVEQFNYDADSREAEILADEAQAEIDAELEMEQQYLEEVEPCYYKHVEDKAEIESLKDGIDNGMTNADCEHQATLDSMSEEELVEFQAEQDRMDAEFEEIEDQDKADDGMEPMPSDYDMTVSKCEAGDLCHADCDEDYSDEDIDDDWEKFEERKRDAQYELSSGLYE